MARKYATPSDAVRFSDHLESWLKSPGPKTLHGVSETFAEKAFAVGILLLMILPALPLPTGGLSHVFEIAAIVLSIQLVIGRKTFWLPGFLGRVKLGRLATGKALVALLKLIRKFESISRPRYSQLMHTTVLRMVSGLIIIGLSVGAFLSPPFVGLDTLPSMGVVAITLAIILDDFVLYLVGVAIGTTGIIITVTLGATITRFIQHLF
jgi:hypothetical protein